LLPPRYCTRRSLLCPLVLVGSGKNVSGTQFTKFIAVCHPYEMGELRQVFVLHAPFDTLVGVPHMISWGHMESHTQILCTVCSMLLRRQTITHNFISLTLHQLESRLLDSMSAWGLLMVFLFGCRSQM